MNIKKVKTVLLSLDLTVIILLVAIFIFILPRVDTPIDPQIVHIFFVLTFTLFAVELGMIIRQKRPTLFWYLAAVRLFHLALLAYGLYRIWATSGWPARRIGESLPLAGTYLWSLCIVSTVFLYVYACKLAEETVPAGAGTGSTETGNDSSSSSSTPATTMATMTSSSSSVAREA